MRRLSLLVGFILVAVAGGFAAVLVATSAESAPPPPKGVVMVAEQNVGTNGGIRVEQQGVAAITISGIPTFRLDTKQIEPIPVQSAPREQFQQFVEVRQTGQNGCGPVTVPDDRRLTIESLSADVLTGSTKPSVWLRSRVSHPDGTTSFGSSVALEMGHVTEDLWSGHTTTLVFSGPTAPDGDAYEYDVCASSVVVLRAYVAGYLD